MDELNKKPKLSIIVPVYNVALYIDECISSLVNNTYDNLEIILVDDGSTDGCGRICDKWAEKFENIEVIHKTNAGLISARKSGVLKATGDYITFVDGDDYVAVDLYEKIVRIISEKRADIICFGFTEILCDKVTRIYSPGLAAGMYYDEMIHKKIMPAILYDASFEQKLNPSVWAKIFRRGIFADNMHLVPDIKIRSEDVFFSLAVMKKARNIWIDNEISGYYYRLRAGSLSHRCNELYWKELNNYYSELEVFRNSCMEEECWKNLKTDKLCSTEIKIEEGIRTSDENVWLLAKKFKKIFFDNKEIEKIIREYRMRELSVSWRKKLYLLFFKWHFYIGAVILKKVLFKIGNFRK